VLWNTLGLSYDFLGFLKSGLTIVELLGLVQLKDGEEEPNVDAHRNTFQVGIEKGIKMLELEPMKNNLNLKSKSNMQTVILIFYCK
jgi:hypothetical protein